MDALANNTVKMLNAAGTALGVHVSAVFNTARELRKRIAVAASIAALDAIRWP